MLLVAGGAAYKLASQIRRLPPMHTDSEADSGLPTGTAALDPARVAVLHFEDETEDSRLRALCAGFTRKLIHELSAIGSLNVISYNGIRQYYQRSEVTPDSLGRALGVGTIVEASVSESGGQLRVLAKSGG